jgi:PPOX class probable F420-dependent enzyme
MSSAEWKAFVSEGTRTAKLAVTRADGRPHVVPVWFVLDGDDFVFTTHAATIKGKALRRDGRAALVVDDERPPFSFVMVGGTAQVSEDLDELRIWATRIGARYMGAFRAEEFGTRNAVEGEMLVRLTPTNVVATADMAGYD